MHTKHKSFTYPQRQEELKNQDKTIKDGDIAPWKDLKKMNNDKRKE